MSDNEIKPIKKEFLEHIIRKTLLKCKLKYPTVPLEGYAPEIANKVAEAFTIVLKRRFWDEMAKLEKEYEKNNLLL
jgi:hypothetical protein